MINNRAQYDFVNIPVNMTINGDVMPNRVNRNLLRGEDACFIVESYKEREIAAFGSDPGSHDMDFVIRGTRLGDAADWYRNYVERPDQRSPMAVDATGMNDLYRLDSYTASIGTGVSPVELDDGLILRSNRLKSSPFNFGRNSPVRTGPILDLFDDIKLVRQFQTNAPPNIANPWASGVEYDVVKTGDYEISLESPPTILNWDFFRDSTLKQEMKTGYGRFELPLGSQRMKYIGNCWIFASYSVFISRNNESEDPNVHPREWHLVFYPTQAIRGQSSFSIGASDVVRHMNDIKTLLDMNFDPMNPNGGINRAYIRAFCSWIVIEMNDRTLW